MWQFSWLIQENSLMVVVYHQTECSWKNQFKRKSAINCCIKKHRKEHRLIVKNLWSFQSLKLSGFWFFQEGLINRGESRWWWWWWTTPIFKAYEYLEYSLAFTGNSLASLFFLYSKNSQPVLRITLQDSEVFVHHLRLKTLIKC